MSAIAKSMIGEASLHENNEETIGAELANHLAQALPLEQKALDEDRALYLEYCSGTCICRSKRALE